MKLEEIRDEYKWARWSAGAAAKAPHSPESNFCRYCGEPWKPVAGTMHDGHVRCIVPRSFQEELHKLWWNSPTLSEQQIADILGITVSTVRGWFRGIDRRTNARP